jgi:hypothetical protein
MDLETFRRAVDGCPAGVTPFLSDPMTLLKYFGMSPESVASGKVFSEVLYDGIRGAFASGHQGVWVRCKALQAELIQRNVIDSEALDPYFGVLERMMDALRGRGALSDEIHGDWETAIRHASDHVKLQDWGTDAVRQKTHAREFEVAKAAKRLRTLGYAISFDNGKLGLLPQDDQRLVADIERRVAAVGGINVARRVFKAILPAYDDRQERYHLIRHTSPTGGGQAEIPFGYLFQLAAKYAFAKTRGADTDANWGQLLRLAVDYAAVLDVQNYVPNLWLHMDAGVLLRYLQETAVADTLFRIPQMRGGDVVRLIRGVLEGLDADKKYGGGWSINDVLAVTGALLELSRDSRGPWCVSRQTLGKACRDCDPTVLGAVLDEVLTHLARGVNQGFSRPSDAPLKEVAGREEAGHDFFLRPLLRHRDKEVFLLDRAACGGAFLEALLTPLRGEHRNFDDRQIGPAIERFLRGEFDAHRIPTLTGCYSVDGRAGECDLIVETAQHILLFEMKKKPLTRRAQAGSDAHLLLDLANSLLAAQVQAGWHEVLLRRHGFLDLTHEGASLRLELRGRGIERIAVSLLDYGSFQDRVFSKQFLEGTLNAVFGINEPTLKSGFNELNKSLEALREQIRELYRNQPAINQPFFHCWFLSVPQLLILLDGVEGAEAFRRELWRTRHIVTGSSNFYWDYAHTCQISADAEASRAAGAR